MSFGGKLMGGEVLVEVSMSPVMITIRNIKDATHESAAVPQIPP